MRYIALALLLAGAAQAFAWDHDANVDPANPDTWPVIAIVIDDLGNTRDVGERTLALPGPVACSILPHSPFAAEFSRTAHQRGKEVMLHQPMQATTSNHLLGPGALTTALSEEQVRERVYANLGSLRHVTGVNNHMGSKLTRHTRAMVWLMRALRDREEPLFFVDSLTTGASVAGAVADVARLKNARRDVFLDNLQTPRHVLERLNALKKRARNKGFALGIGHPYPVTLDVLEQALPDLAANGYRLVSVREMMQIRDERASAPLSVAGAGTSPPNTFRQK
ncbi:MAG: divergent polysaccharide deacetylase family protein [Gammaproteobacteria bacterium]